ncbi:MAG: hypothetical protein P8Z00_02415 [Anaerolineales bacterium]
MANFTIDEGYWDNFELQDEDIEFLYTDLLETEVPMTTRELVNALVKERIRREKQAIEEQRSSGGDLYQPKESYNPGQKLVFSALGWRKGEVVSVRPGNNPSLGDFQVIQVEFDNGEQHNFAGNLANHKLNAPLQITEDIAALDVKTVLEEYGEDLEEWLGEGLEANEDFVRIAGRWFPRALLVDVNVGHLNLAEAVLDMAGGGPVPTSDLLEQIDLSAHTNPKLLEFSLDLALQEDPRFDEVGPAGNVLWFLKRLEPAEVLEPPTYLRYAGMEYEREVLTPEMIALERELDDELSPLLPPDEPQDSVEVPLIYPHWRSGTLPLSSRLRPLFPTAYEAPRIRFMLVDGDSGDQFPGWVVPEKRYVFGLKEWYVDQGLMPGSIVHVRRSPRPGEVIVQTDSRRSSREWIRTVLVGTDGGLVFAMLKQIVTANFDERMAIAVPDEASLDQAWQQTQKDRPPFEKVVVNIMRELAKLNPQSHVHASELYAAINILRRCPPAPLLALLASRSWFVHVGDLHFRFGETD